MTQHRGWVRGRTERPGRQGVTPPGARVPDFPDTALLIRMIFLLHGSVDSIGDSRYHGSMDESPFARGERVVVDYEPAGWFHGKHGAVKSIAWRLYPRGKKKPGWWVTFSADLPPHLQKAECESHSDHVRAEAATA